MIPQIVKRYLVEWSERQEGDWFQSSKEFDSMNKAIDFIESLKQTYPVESRVHMIRIKEPQIIYRPNLKIDYEAVIHECLTALRELYSELESMEGLDKIEKNYEKECVLVAEEKLITLAKTFLEVP
jgi:hypothetical protein